MAAAMLVMAVGVTTQSAGAATSPRAGDAAAAGTPSAGCGKTPTLTSGKRTIQSGGKSRSFILKIPDTYDNSHPHRLAFGYHWLGGTAEQVSSGGSDGYAWAYYGMQSQSGNTTIFVAPQGIGNGWGNSGGEDVTFTDDMIRLIESDLCVDTTQLFSIGFSYGGAMSYALACARATVFRAVVAIAAPGAISGCSGGTQPIAYMGIHGVSDNIGAGRGLRDTFVRNNGCPPQNAPEPAAGSGTHFLTVYSGCRTGYPVVWAPFDGGHQQGPVDGCTGCESGARSWDKAEIWKFFSQFDGTTTPPPVQVGVNYRLVAAHSGKSADITGGSTAAGATLIQWQATSGVNQQFDFLASADGYYRIRARHSGLVLQAAGSSSGADITQQPDSDAPSQQWKPVDQGGAVSLVNRLSGLAMDVWGASTADGARISQYAASGNANQRFQLQSL